MAKVSEEATSGTEATAPVVVPRPASTVLLVRDDPFEVLLVLRSVGHDFYPSVFVFPGGRVEDHDASPAWQDAIEHHEKLSDSERAHRIAALRETHEEAAILIAHGVGDNIPLPVAGAQAFQELVVGMGARLLLDEVVPFAHWITPPGGPKRFDTRFYLSRAPDGQLAQADATETDDVRWMNPTEAVDLARAGELDLPSPTWMNLMLLAQAQDTEQALARARARSIVPVISTRPPGDPIKPGWSRLGVPLEAGYGGTVFDVPGH